MGATLYAPPETGSRFIDIEFFVRGVAVAQPRPRAVRRGQHAGVYDPGTADGWKKCIHAAAQARCPAVPIDAPICLTLVFYRARPKSHFGTGRNAGALKPAFADAKWDGTPDFENLAKAVADALTDVGMWRDDSLVVTGLIGKRWGKAPGCFIRISTDPEEIKLPEINKTGGGE